MRFKNPANGYEEEASGGASWLWCLLFNWAYFAAKGNWKHAFLYFLATVCTLGLAILIYPLFVYQINDDWYRRNGWIQIGESKPKKHEPMWLKVVVYAMFVMMLIGMLGNYAQH